MKNKTKFKDGDTVYAWSNERYNKSYIVECTVEKVSGTTLSLYAIYDNRSFFREENDVLTYDELMECFKIIKEDHDKENS